MDSVIGTSRITTFFFCFAIRLILADGFMVTDKYGADVHAPDQKVAISWDGEKQEMILSTKVQSKELANFGWIIPIKSSTVPIVELSDAQIFYELSDYFNFTYESFISYFVQTSKSASDFDSIQIIQTLKLDIYDITILKASDSDQLFHWLKIHNFEPDQKMREILPHYTTKEFYFLAVKINLLNQYKKDVQNIERFGLLKHLSDFSDLILRKEIDSFGFSSGKIRIFTIDSGGVRIYNPLKYEHVLEKVELRKEDFNDIQESLTRLSRVLIELREGLSKPLKITFSPSQPFFPMKISQLNPGEVNVVAYVVSKFPLKDSSQILDILKIKPITKGIHKELEKYLSVANSRYVTKLRFKDDSSKFISDVYFSELPPDQAKKYIYIYSTFLQAIEAGDISFIRNNINHISFKIEDSQLIERKQLSERDQAITEFRIRANNIRSHLPLYFAIKNNHIEIADLLLSHGASVNNDRHLNHLQLAILNNQEDMVKLLLEKGADIEIDNFAYGSALHMAAHVNSTEIAALLLEKGIDINTVDDTLNKTALHIAAEYNNVNMARFLIKNGADIEARNHIDSTPLISAANSSHAGKDTSAVVAYLIEQGANISAYNMHRKSALDYAYSRRRPKVIEIIENRLEELRKIKDDMPLKTLRGHFRGILTVCFNANGDKIISGGYDRKIIIWSLNEGRELLRLDNHTDWVKSICVNHDGQTFVSGSEDGSIIVWDAKNNNERYRLIGHKGSVDSLCISGDGIKFASGSSDGTIIIWDIDTKNKVKTLTGHRRAVNSLSFSPEGTLLLSSSNDRTIKLWDLSTGKNIRTFRGDRHNVYSASLSPDGKWIGAGMWDGTVRIWNVNNSEEKHILKGHQERVNSVVFSPDGLYLLSGGADTKIKIWDVNKGVNVRTYPGHRTSISSLSICPDGHYIASACSDSLIKIWELKIPNTK